MRKAPYAIAVAVALAVPLAVRASEKEKPAAAKEQPQKKSKDKKKDVEAIGDRNVGSGVNFYSLEKEIALGKQLAQEIQQQARIIDDPIIAEYINRVGQNLVRNSDEIGRAHV